MLALFLTSTQVHAGCSGEVGWTQKTIASPNWPVSFGAYTNITATGAGDCVYEQTSFPTSTNWMTGKKSSSSTGAVNGEDTLGNSIFSVGSAQASLSSFTASASISVFNTSNGARGSNNSRLADVVLIVNPNENAANETTYIPIQWCSKYTTEALGQTGSNRTSLAYRDYNFEGERGSFDKITYDGLAYITHSEVGEICRTGFIKMVGKYVHFSLWLITFTQGSLDSTPVTLDDGRIVNIAGAKGAIEGKFTWNLPSGLQCYSASGVFPSCQPCRKENVGYTSIERAAFQGFVRANTESDRYDYEYGGEVYRVCNVGGDPLYNYTYRRLNPTGGDLDPTAPTVAGWHTHDHTALEPTKHYFSFTDLSWVQDNNLDLYLGIPFTNTFKVLRTGSVSIWDEEILDPNLF